MAKGSIAKEQLTSKIIELFPGSFVYGKEIRVPCKENGEDLQIKIALTCAKAMVDPEGDEVSAIPAQKSAFPDAVEKKEEIYATEEEKSRVKELMNVLGL